MAINVRTRLIILAAIPAIALLYFATSDALEKSRLANDMDQLQVLVEVSTKAGALIHELQKERGMSSGFLTSKGDKFATELTTQRNDTDKKNDILTHTLTTLDSQHYPHEIKTILSEAKTNLQALDKQRAGISSLGITITDSAAYYSKAIADLLKFPASVARLSNNGDISQLMSAYTNLLEAKERAGKERAMLTAAFTADKFTPSSLSAFLKNTAAQDVYINEFINYASTDQATFFTATVAGSSVDSVAKIKTTAAENANATTLGIDSANWFALATDRINLIKEVEDKVSADLISAMQTLGTMAKQSMIWSIALTVLSLLATGFTTWYLARTILRQLGGEPDYAVNILREIANGNCDRSAPQ